MSTPPNLILTIPSPGDDGSEPAMLEELLEGVDDTEQRLETAMDAMKEYGLTKAQAAQAYSVSEADLDN